MLRRMLPCAALFFLVAFPCQVRPADEAKPGAPGFVIRLQSLDAWLADAQFLADLFGRGDEAKNMEATVKAMAGEGLKGLDTKQPLALYGSFGPNGIDSTAVLLIPVADEKALLAQLEQLNMKAEKGEDGVYTLQPEGSPFPVYFRFTNKHAYITMRDAEVIGKDKVLPPNAVLPAGETGTAAISLRIDQVPDQLRRVALTQIDVQMAKAKKEKVPGETEVQQTAKAEVIDEVTRFTKMILNQGQELALRLDLDRKGGVMSLELVLSGKEGSKLAEHISDFGKARSTVAGLVGSNSALSGLVHLVLPEKIRKALEPIIDEGLSQGLQKEADKAKRDVAEKILKVLTPTLKSGEVDMAVDLRGPSAKGLYTMISGIKIKEGQQLDKTFRDLVKSMPEKDRSQVKLDADKVDEVAIHRLEVQNLDPNSQKLFGNQDAIYLAIGPEAIFITIGEDSLNVMKQTIKAGPQTGLALRLEIALGRMAPLMVKEQPKAAKAAEKAFTPGKGDDKITLALQGGKELRLRLSMKTQVLNFIHLLEPTAGEDK